MSCLDLEWVRSRFPALDSPWALFDNAGGSVPAASVIERVSDYMSRLCVQHGASYELSQAASEAVANGRAAAARLVGSADHDTLLGPSSTVLAARLAAGLRHLWQPGDEVIVTDLDHETNIGPWRGLRQHGIEVREWPMRRDTQRLELEDLEPLLSDRTRLVAFTHCANVVGTVHDAASICARVRSAGAFSCVDGVAFAPHRRVDLEVLGADFYLASLYKVFGPHIGLLAGRKQALRAAPGCNHYFVSEEDVPSKFEPGGVTHELVAGLVGIVDYLEALDSHHGGAEGSSQTDPLVRAFDRIREAEAELLEPLIAFLVEHPAVSLIGEPTQASQQRVGTVAFHVEGRHASEIPAALDQQRVAIRWGHFYAKRAIAALGLEASGGVVRASLLHYNTPLEVERLIEGLAATLG